MADWIGFMVSINCTDNGTYQGQILSATNSNITLTKAFCDGIPNEDDVTILASNINNLKLLEKQPTKVEKEKSIIKIAKPLAKRIGRTSSLSESSFTNKAYSAAPNKSKPVDIQQAPEKQHNGNETQSGSHKNSTPTKKDKNKSKWCQKWKDEQCFGSLDQSYSKDFDFEKNLALFDKRAIWDEINNAHKPDVIKHTDQNRRYSKYRHDENVLATTPTVYRQITVPDQPSTSTTMATCSYVTDDGLVVPSIPLTLRNRLWQAADRVGLGWERRVELLGRATTEMALQLVGGAHRLSPTNGHQHPRVVILCGGNRQGATGLNAARHLASHGVDTIVYIEQSNLPSYVQHELLLYTLCKNRVVNTVDQLPTSPVDLSIVALCDEICDGTNAFISEEARIETMTSLYNWVNNNRAPALAVDPSPSGVLGAFDPKYSIIPALPLCHGSRNGKLYLCNLGIPEQLFADIGISYKSPFGAKFVIPLYPNDT